MLKVISRSSQLALLQVQELFTHLLHVEYQQESFLSYGDKHKEISLMDNPDPDFFTRELDEMLIRGEADIAIHSAKDLPYPLRDELRVVALTAPVDQSDSLAGPYDLQTLPEGARVGVSSPSRRAQLLECRPDVECISIRGSIEERLEYIDRGEADAIIVATCALQRLGLSDRMGGRLDFHTHPLQGLLAVTARYDRPDLKALFYPIDHRNSYGRVSLLGFGPGHPGLLTLKGDEVLQNADIIYHDDLLDQDYLDRYPGDRVYVGKRKKAHHKIQEEIHELLYQSALKGKRVVRLKGGDPFIFGRGGEEQQILQERMVPVDVIPGISAVQAAGVGLSAPLTHRGLSDQLHVYSGHHAQDKEILDGLQGTLAFYMASTKKEELRQQLLSRFDGNTPVSAIQWASQPWEKTWKGSIETLSECDLASPLLIMVGPTSGLSHSRSRIWHTGLHPHYTRLPYDLVHYPLIRIQEIEWNNRIEWNKYGGIIFTSRNGVDQFLRKQIIPRDKKIAAIGKVTTARLKEHGFDVSILPPEDNSFSMTPVIQGDADCQYLYPGSEISYNPLHDLPNVHFLPIYTTKSIQVHPGFALNDLEGVVFTSPSTVRSFIENFQLIPGHLTVYARGPMVVRELRKHNLKEENLVTL